MMSSNKFDSINKTYPFNKTTMRILTSSLVLSLTLSVFAADWPQ